MLIESRDFDSPRVGNLTCLPSCKTERPGNKSPRGGNFAFSRCLAVGDLTLACMKMSNSPGSDHRALHTLGLNIDRRIKPYWLSIVDKLLEFDRAFK